MTDIYLDNLKIEFEDTEKDTTVGRLVSVLEEQLKTHRRFICGLSVDGEEFDSWRDDPVSKRLILEFNELNLTSSTVESIALVGVDVLERYLNVVLENINKCIETIRTGGNPIGASSIIVIDGMAEIAKTMFELSKGGQKYDITIFRADPTVYYKRILESLETLNRAKESVDSVLMADVLEYELKELVEEMLRTLFAESKS